MYGSVSDEHGNVQHQVFGRWVEAIYSSSVSSDGSHAKCIWRPG